MKFDNLQYNRLGRWDERLIDQASDVPSTVDSGNSKLGFVTNFVY